MSPANDSALTCPNCGYNLTGLPENRCPECGERFDPDELRRIAAGGTTPVKPWETERHPAAFLATWWLTASAPMRFARGFPPRHEPSTAAGYSAACYFLAGAVFLFSSLLGAGEASPVHLACVLAGVVSCWLCEAVTAAVLALLVKPRRAPKGYHFWRGLTHYTSGFCILTALWGGAAVYIATTADEGLLILPGVIILLWWVLALCAMIVSRTEPGLFRWCACFAVLLIGAASIGAGIFLTVILVIVMMG